MFDSCPLDLPPYRGLVAAVYNIPAIIAVLGDLPGLLSSSAAETLHDGRNKIVAVRFPMADSPSVNGMNPSKSAAGEAVVKIFGARGFHKLKTLLLPSKGIRAWRGSVALREGGFETPFPIAAYERRQLGVVVESVFIAERLRGGQEVRGLFRDLPETELRALISGLALVLADLHNAGLVHRDLSDGNIFVQACAPEPEKDGFRRGEFPDLQFHFLDTNRVRMRPRLGTFGRARNLVRLGVPVSLRAFFLDQYALAAGPSFPRTRFAFYYRTAKRTFEFWLAFKKAFRLRAIARKLGLQ